MFEKFGYDFSADLKQYDYAYIVEADLPGVDKESINIKIEGNYLTISAYRLKTTAVFIHKERKYGELKRKFCVDNVDENNIKHSYDDGILRVELPKTEKKGAGENEEITFNEYQLINLYGLLFKVAYVDGELDKDELRKIFEVINTGEFSEQGKLAVHKYLEKEPDIDGIIKNIKSDIKEIKYLAYLNSIEVSICNDEENSAQQELLGRLKNEFGISDEQDEEMRKFAKEAKRIASMGIDDNVANEVMKTSLAGLTSVGVPIAAVYFSGSVIGLSAAGITSGLAALGLGLGMVPGVGVAILLGTVLFTTLKKFFDVGIERQKQEARIIEERRAEQVIINLGNTINFLIEEISGLEKKAQVAEANKEAINKLQEIVRKLNQIQNAKKEVVKTC